ncbi:hypothetical protein [Mycoplasma phocoenae]|uniref:Uncharacterized protein n=1 Tax=Mycoplasma phocoenae TaxID=754517 RepID=A0A858U3C3_9MOLU|nr:hypothetical protein [Mycoplasma phocoenae]QJG66970.1 hypothetical protein HGG69_01370 [Mycoplasma phocoenae]
MDKEKYNKLKAHALNFVKQEDIEELERCGVDMEEFFKQFENLPAINNPYSNVNINNQAVINTQELQNQFEQYLNAVNSEDEEEEYEFYEYMHCHDPELLALEKDLIHGRFDLVEQKIRNFTDDYKYFGFLTLADIENDSFINHWLQKDSENTVAKLSKAYWYLVSGKKIRGSKLAIETNEDSLRLFTEYINHAAELLNSIEFNKTDFKISYIIIKLHISKILEPENRKRIHDLFEEGINIDPRNIGLHIAYFEAIALKWGGLQTEVDSYLENALQNKNELLEWCIKSIFYWDVISYFEYQDEQLNKGINNFIEEMIQTDIPNNLYRYILFLNLYRLAFITENEQLENFFYNLVKPYWDDRIDEDKIN